MCNVLLHGFCHLIDLIDERDSVGDENARQLKSDLFGLISLNYRFIDSARYRAFVAEVSNVDKSYNDPRLRPYKPERNVQVIFVHYYFHGLL